MREQVGLDSDPTPRVGTRVIHKQLLATVSIDGVNEQEFVSPVETLIVLSYSNYKKGPLGWSIHPCQRHEKPPPCQV